MFHTFYTLRQIISPKFIILTFIQLLELEGAKHFMNAVRDGESVLMGVTDENECHLWVMALYRATGQSHKPTPPTTSDTHHKIMGGKRLNFDAVSNLVIISR